MLYINIYGCVCNSFDTKAACCRIVTSILSANVYVSVKIQKYITYTLCEHLACILSERRETHLHISFNCHQCCQVLTSRGKMLSKR